MYEDQSIILVMANSADIYRRRALAAMEQSGRRWRVVYTSPSLAGVQAAVRTGLGIAVLANDPMVAPVIMFGQEGVAVEVIDDRTVALPPLNINLTAELIQRNRIVRLLKGYHGRPPANMDALHMTLIQASHTIIDLPEIIEYGHQSVRGTE
uniref:GCN5-related N-acetyltransferase:CoA-binding n=1 Tax=Magnetospirillum gryphiswaldense TaxID=55518 RepID=A4TTL7_9PROT|nr:GCN5-related N-acetyltransferase:CoA-binding [Magnetospirillum gryphiswaldense MSR-1]